MNYALIIGRKGSKGFPNKNIQNVMGRKLFEYPLLAALNSKKISRVFVSTDCPVIKKKIEKYKKVTLLNRPKHLATDGALGEEVFQNAYFQIKDIISKQKKKINLLTLLFANAPAITSKMIDKSILILQKNKKLDSVVSTSVYNMWSPLRARKLDKKGLLKPFVKFEYFGNPKTLNCDRDSQGDVYFADMSLSTIRPKNLEDLSKNLLPQKWMGKRIFPLKSWGACDIDYSWQIPGIIHWLKKNGIKKK